MNLLKAAIAVAAAVLISVAVIMTVGAEEDIPEAENISPYCTFIADGKTAPRSLTDDSHYTYFEAEGDSCVIEISAPRAVHGIYIEFAEMPSHSWYIAPLERTVVLGSADYLHSYVDLSRYPSDSLTLKFPFHVKISDIYLLSEGELPSWVQVWEKPYKRADLMLMPTHSDDEHLFFAGILPYCSANGIKAQVVYTVNHNDSLVRPHELLNGLWEAGVTHYPVIGKAPDLYSMGLGAAESVFSAAGYSHDFFVEWQVENLRRFKPLVVVEHADNGEYGHGAHILNNVTMKEAAELSADPTKYPASAEKYGVWDLPKLYIHVYSKRTLTLNWDEPLEHFGGRSAFQVSQDAYRHHRSQHVFPSLSDWLYGKDGVSVTAAAQIGVNSPCRYGLYRSTVGDDIQKNSFFENLTLYPGEEESPSTPESDDQTIPDESEASPGSESGTETLDPTHKKSPAEAGERNGGVFGSDRLTAVAIITAASAAAAILSAAVLIPLRRKRQ